jgi:hypothetical protein
VCRAKMEEMDIWMANFLQVYKYHPNRNFFPYWMD